MRADLYKRLENLEAEAFERVVGWIGEPEGGLAGWEILPGKGSIKVWRLPGETDDELKARAAAEANRYRGMVIAFAMDAQGMTR